MAKIININNDNRYSTHLFSSVLNQSDELLDKMYHMTRNQLLYFEAAISNESDLSLLPEVEQHIQAYKSILDIIDKARG